MHCLSTSTSRVWYCYKAHR